MRSISPRHVVRLLLIVLVCGPTRGMAQAQSLSPEQQLARDIYRELVEINTVTATGDTARAADT